MKTALAVVLALLSSGFLLSANAQAPARPHLSAQRDGGQSQDFTEWIPLGKGNGRSLVYRTHALSQRHASITRALVMIHGGAAGAEGHFRIAVDAAGSAGALGNTSIVAPRIPSNDDYVCNDALAEREINWGCQANNGWPAGGTSAADPALTSYDFVDALLRMLANRRSFPALRTIVIAGHSAGGQFVTRYAMANQVHGQLGVRVLYVVSNPAHYAYPDAGRPFDTTACRIFNDWPYGLQDRIGYSARLTEAQLRTQLASRPVTYLLGDQDILTTGGLDTTCAAMAQGPFRYARGQAFAKYVNEKHNAKHVVVTVPGCGHDPRCMFMSPAARPSLFGVRPQ